MGICANHAKVLAARPIPVTGALSSDSQIMFLMASNQHGIHHHQPAASMTPQRKELNPLLVMAFPWNETLGLVYQTVCNLAVTRFQPI